MPHELDRIKELAGLQQEAAAISPNQIEAFKKWYATYSKMQSKDVYNYAKGIFKAYMETGVTELDGASKQDPNGKAYDDLAKIFPEMDGDIEAIGDALQSQGVDPLDMEAQEESAVQEQDNKPIMINGKQVNVQSIELELGRLSGGRDAEKDAAAESYVEKAFFMDGTELSDAELEILQHQHHGLIYDMAYDMITQQDYDEDEVGEEASAVAELDDKQRTASTLKYSSDPRVAYFDRMMKRYGPKLMELIIDYSHVISNNDQKEKEKLKKYGKDFADFMNHYPQMDGVEEDFIYMLRDTVDKGEEGLINFFYDRVEQAKKAGQFSKTSRLLDPDETHDEFDRKEREKDRKAQGESVSQVDEAIKKATAQLKSFSNFDGLKPYKPKKK